VTEAPVLECRGVDVSYGSVQILFGLDLEVRRNEIVALLGTNGAGKSTLLRAVSQLVTPTAGVIMLDGQDVTRAGPAAVTRAGVVHVPGGKATFPTLTVAEHFAVGSWMCRGVDPADVEKRREEVLELFPRLRHHWRDLGGDLSGGEQQQLALALAFVATPTLLVIDELSLGLAPVVVEELLEVVRRVQAAGCAVLLVEQSVNVALTIAERAYFMEKGEVRFEGPTDELLDRPDVLRSVFFAGALQGRAGPVATDAFVDRRDARPSAVPAGSASARDNTGTDDPAPVLRVDGLVRRFGGVTAVDGVGFELRRGEVLGIIGPNGAGKTTVFDLISGLLPAHAGRVELDGEDISGWSSNRRAFAGVGRSFQDARIFGSLSVAENIAVGLDRHLQHRDHLAALVGLPTMREMEADVAYAVGDLCELFGLGRYRDRRAAELSTGTRRIVDLAMVVALQPSVVLLDEPSSGIAQAETEALAGVLRRLREETGCAVLLIEHDMPLVTSVSDEILALDLGRVVMQDAPAVVFRDPRVVRSYLGSDRAVINRSGRRPRRGGTRRVPLRASRSRE
jgi:branched-chain amino acid transport system ATP-binding protein